VKDPGQFFNALVGSGQPSLVWVWIWKISPKNVKFFNFFPLDPKNLFGSGQRRVSLLFTAGQKYAQVRLGQGPSLMYRQGVVVASSLVGTLLRILIDDIIN